MMSNLLPLMSKQQRNIILYLGLRQGMDETELDKIALKKFKNTLDFLTTVDASSFIQYLQE